MSINWAIQIEEKDKKIKNLEEKLERESSAVQFNFEQGCKFQNRIKDLEQKLSEEQQRTLRYKELLYSQDERTKWVKHHQKCVEIAMKERREAQDKLAEAEEKLERESSAVQFNFEQGCKFQNRIKELEQKLSEAMEVIRFMTTINITIQVSRVGSVNLSKKAKSFLAKHGMEEG